MTTNATEQKLIRIIAEHQIDTGGKKLLIGDVSTEAGITRQAFNRYYKHLTPYVTGKKPIEEIMVDSGTIQATDLLAKSQRRIRKLQVQIDHLKASHEKELRDIKNSYITSLMNNDITLFESDELRVLLEKQSLNNEKLLKRIQELQIELTKEKAWSVTAENRTTENNEALADVAVVDLDLDPVFDNYADTLDLDIFEDAKDAAIEKSLKRINKLSEADDSNLVIFMDRYISSFKHFVAGYRCSGAGTYIIARLPIFTRTELKMFMRKLSHKRPASIHIPFCDSKSVVQAQRGFLFRKVPVPELEQADRAYTPSISDGFEQVVIFSVKQGD